MTMRVLSLGAGVQSSALALMVAHGELDPIDFAIFADVQSEPGCVYDWLDYLEKEISKAPHPFRVLRVTRGNLGDDFLRALSDPKVRCGQPPFFVFNESKQQGAMLWRQCTSEYKIAPIKRAVRKRMKDAGQKHVNQLIGISRDEAHRMKPSRVKYITNEYPLVDLGMTRNDCLRWMEKHGYPMPPKSACTFCPYSSNTARRELRDKHPEDWAKLVEFDYAIRKMQKDVINGAKITGTLYVHRDCKPIDQVDLSTLEDRGQEDMFGNECEGMCGV